METPLSQSILLPHFDYGKLEAKMREEIGCTNGVWQNGRLEACQPEKALIPLLGEAV